MTSFEPGNPPQDPTAMFLMTGESTFMWTSRRLDTCW
jgi:hypothetical protein